MKEEPLLTIITVHKGDFRNLEDTLSSIKNLGDLEKYTELIVVNAHSDSFNFSGQNLFSYKQLLNVNQGIFNAMNVGLGIAAGKYVNFLNSGDTLLKEIDSLELLDMLQSDLHWFVAQTLRKKPNSHEIVNWSHPRKQIKFILALNSYCHQSTFVLRKTLDQFGRLDETSSVSDWGMSVRLSALHSPFELTSPWALYQGSGFSENPNWAKWAKDVSYSRYMARGYILNNGMLDLRLQQIIALALKLKRKIYS